MNILPLVFALLLIFSTLTVSLLKQQKSDVIAERSIEGYHKTSKGVRNALAKKAYRKIKPAPATKTTEAVTSKPAKGAYHSRRGFMPPYENGKFNLRPLIESTGNVKGEPLYPIALELLHLLYDQPLFKKEGPLAGRILDEMITRGKKLKEGEGIEELFPLDPILQRFYYKMLKGTNRYDVATSVGIPRLGDFFSLTSEKTAISLGYASESLLNVIFGKEMSVQILELEKKEWAKNGKYHCISKAEAEGLVAQDAKISSRVLPLQPHFNYQTRPVERTETGGVDPHTKIIVRLPS